MNTNHKLHILIFLHVLFLHLSFLLYICSSRTVWIFIQVCSILYLGYCDQHVGCRRTYSTLSESSLAVNQTDKASYSYSMLKYHLHRPVGFDDRSFVCFSLQLERRKSSHIHKHNSARKGPAGK